MWHSGFNPYSAAATSLLWKFDVTLQYPFFSDHIYSFYPVPVFQNRIEFPASCTEV